MSIVIDMTTQHFGNTFALKNHDGERYGYLTIIGRRRNPRNNTWGFVCRCDCGNEIVRGKDIVRLRHNKIRWSCGCKAQFREPREIFAPTGHPTAFDIVWAAGIFEGEGHCRIANGGLRRTTEARVSQKQPWILERLKCLFGGNVRAQYHTSHETTYFEWHLAGGRARGFLMTVYRFLSPHRQEQALRALDIGKGGAARKTA